MNYMTVSDINKDNGFYICHKKGIALITNDEVVRLMNESQGWKGNYFVSTNWKENDEVSIELQILEKVNELYKHD